MKRSMLKNFIHKTLKWANIAITMAFIREETQLSVEIWSKPVGNVSRSNLPINRRANV